MGQGRDAEHRSAFDRWLRTGFVPSLRSPDGIEVKFNPWHDPQTGRFTFAGMGVRYGDGGADVADAMDDRPRRRPGRWGGGGFTGGGGGRGGGGGATGPGGPDRPPPPPPRRKPTSWTGGGFTGGGGGGFGGAGASVPGRPDRPKPATGAAAIAQAPRPADRSVAAQPETFREVSRNGYLYRIDQRGRTRHVSGPLTLAVAIGAPPMKAGIT